MVRSPIPLGKSQDRNRERVLEVPHTQAGEIGACGQLELEDEATVRPTHAYI